MKADESKEISASHNFHLHDVVVYGELKSLFRIVKIYDDEAVVEHTKTGRIYRRQPLSKFRKATKAERLAEQRLEQPLNACANCPNAGHKTCCHEVR